MRDIQPPNLAQVIRFKEILLYFISIKSFMYFTSFILTLLERNNILKEIKKSIYKDIDCNLNEEIFNNIIEQCENPNNNKLSKKYANLLKKRGKVKEKGINDNDTSTNISEINKSYDLKKPLI